MRGRSFWGRPAFQHRPGPVRQHRNGSALHSVCSGNPMSWNAFTAGGRLAERQQHPPIDCSPRFRSRRTSFLQDKGGSTRLGKAGRPTRLRKRIDGHRTRSAGMAVACRPDPFHIHLMGCWCHDVEFGSRKIVGWVPMSAHGAVLYPDHHDGGCRRRCG